MPPQVIPAPGPNLTGTDPNAALAAMLGLGSQVPSSDSFGFSGGAAPTQGEAESPFERDQAVKAFLFNQNQRAEDAKNQAFADEYAMEQDPRNAVLGAARVNTARETAEAEAEGKGLGAAKAAWSTPAQEAANAEEGRKEQLQAAPKSVPGMGSPVMGPGGLMMMPPNMKPLGQLEQRAITSFAEAQPILNDLEASLHPEGEGTTGQLLGWLKNAKTAGQYKMGIAPGGPEGASEQAKNQLAGLLSVIGSSPYVVGSRSFQMIKLAMQHLTSPLSSDQFKQNQINEIRRLWPQMQQEIISAHVNPGNPALTTNPGTFDTPPTAAELGQ